jgi:hypothetical protein
MKTALSEVRIAAWKTRREKYGARGHAGSYARTLRERRALELIARLHREAVLSEGQCCQALDMGRVDFRAMVDALAPQD